MAQQCGSNGRFRPITRFSRMNSPTASAADIVAAPTATNRSSPPNSRIPSPSAYHSHPSPARDAASIQTRNQRGGIQHSPRAVADGNIGGSKYGGHVSSNPQKDTNHSHRSTDGSRESGRDKTLCTNRA